MRISLIQSYISSLPIFVTIIPSYKYTHIFFYIFSFFFYIIDISIYEIYIYFSIIMSTLVLPPSQPTNLIHHQPRQQMTATSTNKTKSCKYSINYLYLNQVSFSN
jgi:hypothetical protein